MSVDQLEEKRAELYWDIVNLIKEAGFDAEDLGDGDNELKRLVWGLELEVSE